MDGAHRLTFGGRRIRGLIGLVLGGVAVSVALAVALPAQAATRFSDNFEDGNANGWTFTGGSWAVMSEDGSFVLRQQASLAGVAAAVANVTGPGSGFPTFVAASAKPRTALGGTGSVAVLFNAADANNYFYAALRATVLEIGMRQNGTPRVLATTPYAATVGTWQRLTIDLNLPGRIGVIAAGTGPGAQVAVTGLGAATFGNRVGFAATDASASFDNISIVDDVAPDTIPPTTPGTPVASNPTPSGFTLRWAASTDNVGVTGYEVQTVVPPGSTVPIRVWRTPTNSITITDLPARSTWTLHVRAFDAANNFSPFSGNVTASTLPPADQVPPTAPGKPVASNITPTGLTLSWTPSTDNVGVTRYAVYTSTDPILSSVGQTNGATTVTVQSLAPGATYAFVVAAFDAANNRSPFSEPTTVTLPQSVGCVVAYRIVNQWSGGFQADVTVRNGEAAAVNGWRLQWTFPTGQTVGQVWNAVLIGGSGPSVTVGDAGWNATIPAGGSVGFGLIATGTATTPEAFTLNSGGCALA
jgi:hypothetical protein